MTKPLQVDELPAPRAVGSWAWSHQPGKRMGQVAPGWARPHRAGARTWLGVELRRTMSSWMGQVAPSCGVRERTLSHQSAAGPCRAGMGSVLVPTTQVSCYQAQNTVPMPLFGCVFGFRPPFSGYFGP